jgi:hypothetical protein
MMDAAVHPPRQDDTLDIDIQSVETLLIHQLQSLISNAMN